MTALKNEKHFHLDVDVSYGDSLQINTYDGKTFTIEIDQPSAGDTETGFGRTCRVSLGIEQLEEIYNWIDKHLKRQRE